MELNSKNNLQLKDCLIIKGNCLNLIPICMYCEKENESIINEYE